MGDRYETDQRKDLCCCEKECLDRCKDKCYKDCYCDDNGSSCGLIILLILVLYFCCNQNGKGGLFGGLF